MDSSCSKTYLVSPVWTYMTLIVYIYKTQKLETYVYFFINIIIIVIITTDRWKVSFPKSENVFFVRRKATQLKDADHVNES